MAEMWSALLSGVLAATSGQAYTQAVVVPETDAVYAEADRDALLICPAGTTPRMTEAQTRERLELWYGELMDQDVSQKIEATVIKRPSELRYPRRPLAGYGSGLVVAVMLIEVDGSVPEVMVHCSSDPLYEASAVEFLSGYRLAPATLNGKPIRSSARQPVEFGP